MDEPFPALPPRPADGHKGTFGTVLVIGGHADPARPMIGAPALAANAALRAGCGLAAIAAPESILPSILTIAPCATGVGLPIDVDDASTAAARIDAVLGPRACLAIGPGWGTGAIQECILVRALAQTDHPVVLDADALNVLASLRSAQLDIRAPVVITPHPGEYRRLAEALGVDADPTGAAGAPSRTRAAEQLAQRLGVVVVLKGAGTVITDGMRSYVNDTGSPALATAGSGDVLTGVIAGLAAQHFVPNLGPGSRQVEARAMGGLGLLECARIAVRAHGSSSDAWTLDRGAGAGMLALDLLAGLPAALFGGRG